MANDRIYIQCDGCKAWTCLVRYYPYSVTVKDFASEFIKNHLSKCHPYRGQNDLGGVTGFSLIAESEPRVKELDPALHEWSY